MLLYNKKLDFNVKFLNKDLLNNLCFFFNINENIKIKINLNYFDILDLDETVIGRYCLLIYLFFNQRMKINKLRSFTKQGLKTYGFVLNTNLQNKNKVLFFLYFISENIFPFIENKTFINYGINTLYKLKDLDLFTDMLLSRKANVFFKIIRHVIDVYIYFKEKIHFKRMKFIYSFFKI